MNAAATAHATPFSLHDFLNWEADQPLRHEFIEGEAFARTGGTDVHNLITGNAYLALREYAKGKPCRVFMADMKLAAEAADACFYPDIFLTCTPGDAASALVKHDAQLIIEVLSPSTEAYDRGKKFGHYRLIDTLAAYVLIAQDEYRIEAFVRTQDNHWTLYEASGLESVLALPLPDDHLDLALAQIYQDIPLPPIAAIPTGAPA
ncbi:MAG: Uma2 family endonuclease [Halothiobacillus sp.]